MANFLRGATTLKERADNALAFMCAKDGLPFDIVAGDGFRAFVRTLAPDYELPSPNAVQHRVVALAEGCKEAVLLFVDLSQLSADETQTRG